MNDKDIKKLFHKVLTQKVISITDKSKGCDQKVSIVKTKKNIFVLKEPHTEKDKITKEIVATNLCLKKNISVPQVIYSDENILIETYIPGIDLDEIKTSRKNFEKIYFDIGKLMKKMHSIKGKNFGPVTKNSLKGTYKTNKLFIESWFSKEFRRLKETNFYSKDDINKVEAYYRKNSKFLKSKETVLIHADLADQNIVIDDGKISGIIDFGDLIVGSAMLDFTYMYINHHDSYKFTKLIKGYGNVNIKEIKFYTVLYLIWLLASRIERKEFDKLFRRMNYLIMKICG